MVLEMLVYLPLDHLMWLVAQEYFVGIFMYICTETKSLKIGGLQMAPLTEGDNGSFSV